MKPFVITTRVSDPQEVCAAVIKDAVTHLSTLEVSATNAAHSEGELATVAAMPEWVQERAAYRVQVFCHARNLAQVDWSRIILHSCDDMSRVSPPSHPYPLPIRMSRSGVAVIGPFSAARTLFISGRTLQLHKRWTRKGNVTLLQPPLAVDGTEKGEPEAEALLQRPQLAAASKAIGPDQLTPLESKCSIYGHIADLTYTPQPNDEFVFELVVAEKSLEGRPVSGYLLGVHTGTIVMPLDTKTLRWSTTKPGHLIVRWHGRTRDLTEECEFEVGIAEA